MRIVGFLREHRIVAGVVLVNLAIVIVILVMMIMKAGRTATVDILTVPSVAKVKIDGAEYESGAYKIRPGDYEATVTAEGFVTKTVPVAARSGEITKLWVYLVPEVGGFDWYTLKDNYDEFEQLARIVSSEGEAIDEKDEAVKTFVLEYNKNLELYDNILPIVLVEREDVDLGGYVSDIVSISREDDMESCVRYICISAYASGDNELERIEDVLKENGFDIDYLEVNNV